MKTTLLLCLLVLLSACGSKTKQKQSTEQTEVQSIEKRFYNGGLKYETTIQITIERDEKVTGTVISNEYGMENEAQVVSFTGTISDGNINVIFSDEPPIIGAASEWLDKPWRIITNNGKEALIIPFNAKNHEANRWEEVEYEFESMEN